MKYAFNNRGNLTLSFPGGKKYRNKELLSLFEKHPECMKFIAENGTDFQIKEKLRQVRKFACYLIFTCDTRFFCLGSFYSFPDYSCHLCSYCFENDLLFCSKELLFQFLYWCDWLIFARVAQLRRIALLCITVLSLLGKLCCYESRQHFDGFPPHITKWWQNNDSGVLREVFFRSSLFGDQDLMVFMYRKDFVWMSIMVVVIRKSVQTCHSISMCHSINMLHITVSACYMSQYQHVSQYQRATYHSISMLHITVSACYISQYQHATYHSISMCHSINVLLITVSACYISQYQHATCHRISMLIIVKPDEVQQKCRICENDDAWSFRLENHKAYYNWRYRTCMKNKVNAFDNVVCTQLILLILNAINSLCRIIYCQAKLGWAKDQVIVWEENVLVYV
jgi:hypothetical protein